MCTLITIISAHFIQIYFRIFEYFSSEEQSTKKEFWQIKFCLIIYISLVHLCFLFSEYLLVLVIHPVSGAISMDCEVRVECPLLRQKKFRRHFFLTEFMIRNTEFRRNSVKIPYRRNTEFGNTEFRIPRNSVKIRNSVTIRIP